MAYLEELFSDFTKGVRIRRKNWSEGRYISLSGSCGLNLPKWDIIADDWEIYECKLPQVSEIWQNINNGQLIRIITCCGNFVHFLEKPQVMPEFNQVEDYYSMINGQELGDFLEDYKFFGKGFSINILFSVEK